MALRQKKRGHAGRIPRKGPARFRRHRCRKILQAARQALRLVRFPAGVPWGQEESPRHAGEDRVALSDLQSHAVCCVALSLPREPPIPATSFSHSKFPNQNRRDVVSKPKRQRMTGGIPAAGASPKELAERYLS